jgi:Mor family transcriptional regulator
MAKHDKNEFPEFLAAFLEYFADYLVQAGFPPEGAGTISWECAEYIRRTWGGQVVYIPKGIQYDIAKKREQIWAAYLTGEDPDDLARRFDTSVQNIYLVLRTKRQEQQPTLFDALNQEEPNA